MPVRFLHILIAGVVQLGLGACMGFYFGGRAPAVAFALVALAASIALSALLRHESRWLPAQLRLSACLIAVHCAALYTFGNSGHAPWIGAGAQLLVALAALAGCAALSLHLGSKKVMTPPAMQEHDDDTLELPVDEAVDAQVAATGAVTSPPRWRRPWVASVVTVALLVAAITYWLNDDLPRGALGGAVAREVVAPDPVAPPAVAAEEPGTADGEPAILEEPPAPAEAPAPVRDAGVAPSAARRECMAQIESARLFQQIARQSADHDGYAAAAGAQIERMLKARPVGPRTLSRIADRMWEGRADPERGASWWAGQFSRCEQARIAGSWYVVKG